MTLLDNEKEGPYRVRENLPECPWCGEDMEINNRDAMRQTIKYKCVGCTEDAYLKLTLEEAVEEGYKT